jgi:hypothetical protein
MTRYEITVDSEVGPLTAAALEGFQLRKVGHGLTCIVGDVVDQAAFHALLNVLQDLRLDIKEVQRVEEA